MDWVCSSCYRFSDNALDSIRKSKRFISENNRISFWVISPVCSHAGWIFYCHWYRLVVFYPIFWWQISSLSGHTYLSVINAWKIYTRKNMDSCR